MPFARVASALASSIPGGPLEVPDRDTEPGENVHSSALHEVIVSSSASVVLVTRVWLSLMPIDHTWLQEVFGSLLRLNDCIIG